MNHKIILYGNRNTGILVLNYLLAKGYSVKVITEDDDVEDICSILGIKIVTFETMGKFDLFICCHGRKIISDKYLSMGKFINIHPCLYKYRGNNPIRKYIDNKDTHATVEVQHMIKEVDAGEVIGRINFETPVIETYAEFYNIAYRYYIKCLDYSLKTISK